jgi:hypothetical protein
VEIEGAWFETAVDVASLSLSIHDIAREPANIWNWAALGADVVTLALPVAAGGGMVIKGLAKAEDVVGVARIVKKEIRFGQKSISRIFRHGKFAGKSIDEVAAGLRKGTIKPEQLPIKVITRDAKVYTLNNRSLMALRKAGLEPTVIEDVTGNKFFERQLTLRLKEIGEVPSEFMPIIRGGR